MQSLGQGSLLQKDSALTHEADLEKKAHKLETGDAARKRKTSVCEGEREKKVFVVEDSESSGMTTEDHESAS